MHKPRKPVTTLPYPGQFERTDHVKRDFYQPAPHELFCGDIKHIPTNEGPLYLSTVLDLCSRKCVSYCLEDHMRAELIENTLEGAVTRLGKNTMRKAKFHSDQGSQYLSNTVEQFCETHGITLSTGRIATCFDDIVRHEALYDLVEMKGLHLHAVAAA